MKLAIIIPLGRMGNGEGIPERLAVLQHALDTCYKHCALVIVVAQNVPDAIGLQGMNCEVIRIEGEPFNKGWCQNVGFRAALNEGATHICLAETDMWARSCYFETVPAWMAQRRLRWCFGWEELFYTNEAEAQDILDHAIIPKKRPSAIVKPTRGYSEGGYVFFTTEFYKRMGGASEWYLELGGPDNDIAFRAYHLSKTYSMYPAFVYHLWHPKVKRRNSPLRKANIQYLKYTRGHPEAVIKTMRAMSVGNAARPYCQLESFAGARKRVVG